MMLKDIIEKCKGDKKNSKMSDSVEVKKKTSDLSGENSVIGLSHRDHCDSEKEEELLIMENIGYVEQFLQQLKERDSSELSAAARKKISNVKSTLQQWLIEDNPKPPVTVDLKRENISSEVQSQPRRKMRVYSSSSCEDDACYNTHKSESSQASRRSRRDDAQWVKLADVMKSLGGRKIPDMDKYNESTGEEISRYLVRFEKYCRDNVNGGRESWLAELKSHLEGRALKAFDMMKGVGDSYDEVKEKLVDWFNAERVARHEKKLKNFEKMKQNADEELFWYCCKLENAYKMAYPRGNLDDSVLQRKFAGSITKPARKMLKTYKMVNRMTDKKMTWKEVKRCAHMYDCERETKEERNVDSDDEIVIDVGQKYKSNSQTYDQQRQNRHDDKVYYSNRYRYSYDSSPEKFHRDHQSRMNEKRKVTFEPRKADRFDSCDEDRYSYRQPVQERTEVRPWNDAAKSRDVDKSVGRRLVNAPASLRYAGMTCYYCKRIGHIARNCRSLNRKCFNCGEPGHFQRDCTRGRRTVQGDRARSQSAGPHYRSRRAESDMMYGANEENFDTERDDREEQEDMEMRVRLRNLSNPNHTTRRPLN